MVRKILIGFFLTLTLLSCASFTYKYYGLDLDGGKLLGPTASDDLSIVICKPNLEAQFPCTVMLYADFFAMKEDYLRIKERLKKCEEH